MTLPRIEQQTLHGEFSDVYHHSHVDSRYWLIPPEIYEPLDQEFKFTFDPCPFPFQKDGIEIDWGDVNWVNPPFRKKDSINGHGPTAFVRKAIEEQAKGKTSVMIMPVQSYVNMLLEAGVEIRPVGRVRWVDANTGRTDPSPSTNALFVLRGRK
jgi:hypothetical protein